MAKTDTPNPLAEAINKAGGPITVAKECGVTPQAVSRWVIKKRLPRTEYTGETQYAKVISRLAGDIDAEELLSSLRQVA